MNPDGISDPITWSNYIQDEGFDKNLDIKISKDGKYICSISGITPNFEIKIIDNDEKLYHAFLTSGLVEWFFNYSDGKTASTNIDSINLEGDIEKWFSVKLNGKILVVDTNIIIDRIFSSLNLLGHNITSSNDVRIPRLTILELERISNESSDFKRKKAKMGYSELMYMKNNGAKSMRELPIELLTGFSNIAKGKKTDSWIRREIVESRLRDLRARIVSRFVLMTSDLINSFSALAEDIDTISVSKINNWKEKLRAPELEQIGRSIITISVLYENIMVNINGKKFEVNGVWEGKTTSNWNFEQVFYKEK